MFCVVGNAWTGMYPVVPGLSISCRGYRVFVVSSGMVASFLVLIEMSISGIYSGGVTSICGVTYMSLSSWVCDGS